MPCDPPTPNSKRFGVKLKSQAGSDRVSRLARMSRKLRTELFFNEF